MSGTTTYFSASLALAFESRLLIAGRTWMHLALASVRSSIVPAPQRRTTSPPWLRIQADQWTLARLSVLYLVDQSSVGGPFPSGDTTGANGNRRTRRAG